MIFRGILFDEVSLNGELLGHFDEMPINDISFRAYFQTAPKAQYLKSYHCKYKTENITSGRLITGISRRSNASRWIVDGRIARVAQLLSRSTFSLLSRSTFSLLSLLPERLQANAQEHAALASPKPRRRPRPCRPPRAHVLQVSAALRRHPPCDARVGVLRVRATPRRRTPCELCVDALREARDVVLREFRTGVYQWP